MISLKVCSSVTPHTVQHIAEEFGVTRPTIYRHLAKP